MPNQDINGTLKAGENAEVWAGGKVAGSVEAPLGINIQAGGSVAGLVTSGDGDISVWADGDVSADVTANQDIYVESSGAVTGTVKADGDVSVVATGDVTGSVKGNWVADVRSGGQVTGTVSTAHSFDDLAAADSPSSIRRAAIDAQIADLTAQGQGNSDAVRELQAERDLLGFGEQEIDFQHIPADRIRAMIRDGVVTEYNGDPYEGYATKGYVVFVDVV